MTLSPGCCCCILLLIFSVVDAGDLSMQLKLTLFRISPLPFCLFFFFFSTVILVFVKCGHEENDEERNRPCLCKQSPSEAADAGSCSENPSSVGTLLPQSLIYADFYKHDGGFPGSGLGVWILFGVGLADSDCRVSSTCLASLMIGNKYLSTDWVLLRVFPPTYTLIALLIFRADVLGAEGARPPGPVKEVRAAAVGRSSRRSAPSSPLCDAGLAGPKAGSL